MKKPKSIPLSDSPRCKEVSKFPLKSNNSDIQTQEDIYPHPELYKTFWKTHIVEEINENNQQNNSEGIQQLESDSSD